MTGPTLHRIPIELTAEQRRQILEATGQEAEILLLPTKVRVLRSVFAGIPLRVSRGVFPPQPASERMLRAALELIDDVRQPVLVEVGTGCGAVALALATSRPDASIHATDLSAAALRCARQNRRRLGIRNLRFHAGSLAEPLPARLRGQVAMLAANIPYVPDDPSVPGIWPEGTALGLGGTAWTCNARSHARRKPCSSRGGGWSSRWESGSGNLSLTSWPQRAMTFQSAAWDRGATARRSAARGGPIGSARLRKGRTPAGSDETRGGATNAQR